MTLRRVGLNTPLAQEKSYDISYWVKRKGHPVWPIDSSLLFLILHTDPATRGSLGCPRQRSF
jgi:hypothetical protein